MSPGSRVVGIDVARCVALVGMVSTHTLEGFTADGLGVTWHQQLAGGRSAALFAVLAGVSLALVSGGTRPPRGRAWAAASAGVVVRGLLVAAVGLALGLVDSPIAVILAFYGLGFVLVVPFLRLGTRALVVLAASWAVVSPLVSHALRRALDAPEALVDPTFSSLRDPGPLLEQLLLTGVYPALPWLTYFLVGLAVGRCDLRSTRLVPVLLVCGGALVLVSVVVSDVLVRLSPARDVLAARFPGGPAYQDAVLTQGLAGTTPTTSWWWLVVRAPHSSTPFDLAQTVGSALVVIAVCLVVGRMAPRVLSVVLGAGAMTLTLYALHVVLHGTVWEQRGDDVFWRHVALLLAIGAVFALLRRRGPLETVVGVAASWARRQVGGQVGGQSGGGPGAAGVATDSVPAWPRDAASP